MAQEMVLRIAVKSPLLEEINAEVDVQRRIDLSGNTNRSSLLREIIAEGLANRASRRATVALDCRKD